VTALGTLQVECPDQCGVPIELEVTAEHVPKLDRETFYVKLRHNAAEAVPEHVRDHHYARPGFNPGPMTLEECEANGGHRIEDRGGGILGGVAGVAEHLQGCRRCPARRTGLYPLRGQDPVLAWGEWHEPAPRA
jgi:hypothetical protein